MIKSIKQKKSTIASGASYGALADDKHAMLAVKKALKKSQSESIGSVLLFLSSAYAHKPQGAIKQAAIAAGTTQVFGCCAMSLLTEQEWLLDVEGAVAMVFPPEMALLPAQIMQQQALSTDLLITLSSPNAAIMAVNKYTIPQAGGISSDEFGHGPHSIWQSGRIVESEFCHFGLASALKATVVVVPSIRQISAIQVISESQRHDLISIEGQPALTNLIEQLPENLRDIGFEQPHNILCGVSENTNLESIQQGHYKLLHVVANDKDSGRILLSGSIQSGHHMFWAIRDKKLTEKSMQSQLQSQREAISSQPLFALMFSNIGRGPAFFNNDDQDLLAFKTHFPQVPLIGFYSNGEIAPGHQLAGLIHHYSNVLVLFNRPDSL